MARVQFTNAQNWIRRMNGMMLSEAFLVSSAFMMMIFPVLFWYHHQEDTIDCLAESVGSGRLARCEFFSREPHA